MDSHIEGVSRVERIFQAHAEDSGADTMGRLQEGLAQCVASVQEAKESSETRSVEGLGFEAAAKEVEVFRSLLHTLGRILEKMASDGLPYEKLVEKIKALSETFDLGPDKYPSLEYKALLILKECVASSKIAAEWDNGLKENALWELRDVLRIVLLNYDLALHGPGFSNDFLEEVFQRQIANVSEVTEVNRDMSAKTLEVQFDPARHLAVVATRLNDLEEKVSKDAGPYLKAFRAKGVLESTEVLSLVRELMYYVADVFEKARGGDSAALYAAKDLYEDSILRPSPHFPIFVREYMERAVQNRNRKNAMAKSTISLDAQQSAPNK